MEDDNFEYAETVLETWTRGLWQRSGDLRWQYYLGPRPTGGLPEPLLHIEMKYAKQRECLPRLKEGEQVTLVILVGDRFEPLLQTVWAYQPDRIVPVVNEYYGSRQGRERKEGHEQWRELWQLVQRLPLDVARRPNPADEAEFRTAQDNPASVFDYLRDRLRDDLADPHRRVVIDITGAKKSMVAGAYLFAAYTNAEVSYVDFDRYDPNHGPFGYSCRIGRVPNPFHEWSLRSWERAAQLYGQHDFAGALAILPEILAAGPPAWNASLAWLRLYVDMCHDWENGHLKAAQRKWIVLPDELKQRAPVAIVALHEHWPDETASGDSGISQAFLLSPRLLMIYGRDELARARRLAGLGNRMQTRRDFRSAFARAYALHETLLKARVVWLFTRDYVSVRLDKSTVPIRATQLTPEWRAAGLSWMLNWMESERAYELICSTKEEDGITARRWEIASGEKKHPVLWRNCDNPRNNPASILDMRDPVFSDFAEGLRLKRNRITHTYMPVSRQDAENAIQLAEANLEDYGKEWGKLIDEQFDPGEVLPDVSFDVPEWDELLAACHLTFIPTPRPTAKEDI
jgi:hypothetical protein